MNFLDPRLPDRFWAKAIPEPNTGCWIWAFGRIHRLEYGHIHRGSRTDGTRQWMAAHVFAYEEINGQVPSGLELDHRCRVRSCVNPDHLEPVTHTTNVRRGAVGILSERVRVETLAGLSGEEWMMLRDVADRFPGVRRGMISCRLQRLLRSGLVERRVSGRDPRFYEWRRRAV